MQGFAPSFSAIPGSQVSGSWAIRSIEYQITTHEISDIKKDFHLFVITNANIGMILASR